MSARGAPLGAATFATAACVFGSVACADRTTLGEVPRAVSWSVLVLVAGLFVLVQGLDDTGLLAATKSALEAMSREPLPLALLLGSGSVALVSNLVNNLPAGLVAGSAAASLHAGDAFRSAVAIGIDLGPNLSVTGSLATILWLSALRRAGLRVDAWRFLRSGLVVMPPALIAAVLALLVTSR